MESIEVCKCPDCEKRAKKEKEQEEMNLAVLLAIVPMLVLTLFGQIGFF
jgi:hypothetical protein